MDWGFAYREQTLLFSEDFHTGSYLEVSGYSTMKENMENLLVLDRASIIAS